MLLVVDKIKDVVEDRISVGKIRDLEKGIMKPVGIVRVINDYDLVELLGYVNILGECENNTKDSGFVFWIYLLDIFDVIVVESF